MQLHKITHQKYDLWNTSIIVMTDEIGILLI